MGKRPPRNYAHGHLDFTAALVLAKYPTLELAEIAAKLKCSPGTLRNRRKCPHFVEAWERIRAGAREGYRHGAPPSDRRRNGRPMADD